MEKIYAEVNQILNLLGDYYIKKLPKDLYNLIKNSKDNNYKIKFNSLENISTDNCSKEAIDMIALFHLNYWCENEIEKKNLDNIFNNNYVKNEAIKAQQFDTNVFTKKEAINTFQSEPLVNINKESFFNKILNKLKKVFNIFHN